MLVTPYACYANPLSVCHLKRLSHFLENGSNVYACLPDASSAFDRVHYGKLFDVLMKRNMSAVFIRLLLDSYFNHRICAAWGALNS